MAARLLCDGDILRSCLCGINHSGSRPTSCTVRTRQAPVRQR
uniref:Uncharacterized protein n=1 Tax=Setaria italica TaxID=4555 RepID=K3XTG2_SETIT